MTALKALREENTSNVTADTSSHHTSNDPPPLYAVVMKDTASEADMDALIQALEEKINTPSEVDTSKAGSRIQATKMTNLPIFTIRIPMEHKAVVKELEQHPQVKIVSDELNTPVQISLGCHENDR